jgi:hypothetical protein
VPVRRVILAVALVLSIAPGIAEAEPTLSLAARAIPVVGFPHTGNIAGAGATLEVALEIGGHGYGGYPPPLTHLNLILPRGTRWNVTGFPTCSGPDGELGPPGPWPARCPRASRSRQSADALFAVAFGHEVVPENASITVLYRSGGGIFFYVFGREPVLFEDLALGRFVRRGTTEILEVSLPIVETVPDAQSMSTSKLSFFLGSAVVPAADHHDFSLRMPTACPQGHLTFKVEAAFVPSQQVAMASARAPCPSKPLRLGKRRSPLNHSI